MPYIYAIVDGRAWELDLDAELSWMLGKEYRVYCVLPVDY